MKGTFFVLFHCKEYCFDTISESSNTVNILEYRCGYQCSRMILFWRLNEEDNSHYLQAHTHTVYSMLHKYFWWLHKRFSFEIVFCFTLLFFHYDHIHLNDYIPIQLMWLTFILFSVLEKNCFISSWKKWKSHAQ